MGGVPGDEVQVLDFRQFAEAQLIGDRYELIADREKNQKLRYSFDSEQAPKGYRSLADALFVADASGRTLAVSPVAGMRLNVGRDGMTEFVYHLEGTYDGTRSTMLCALVFPHGYAGDQFSVGPINVKAVGGRLAVLFVLDGKDGEIRFTWRTFKSEADVNTDVKRVFDAMTQRHAPRPMMDDVTSVDGQLAHHRSPP